MSLVLLCQRFESQMSSKQPAYCLVRRLGVALCNRCDKEDPEREQLTDMLCSLGSLWHKMRAVAAQRSVSLLRLMMKLHSLDSFTCCCHYSDYVASVTLQVNT